MPVWLGVRVCPVYAPLNTYFKKVLPSPSLAICSAAVNYTTQNGVCLALVFWCLTCSIGTRVQRTRFQGKGCFSDGKTMTHLCAANLSLSIKHTILCLCCHMFKHVRMYTPGGESRNWRTMRSTSSDRSMSRVRHNSGISLLSAPSSSTMQPVTLTLSGHMSTTPAVCREHVRESSIFWSCFVFRIVMHNAQGAMDDVLSRLDVVLARLLVLEQRIDVLEKTFSSRQHVR